MHPAFTELLVKEGFLIFDATKFSREQILDIIHEYHGMAVRSRILIDRELIDKAQNLKFIARAGAGMESIDTEYAALKSVECINSPEGNRDALAEHAVGMLLSMMNRLHIADREVRAGKWVREGNRGHELGGKTVGIIGYGNMGSAFAKRLKGFDVHVIAYDKYKTGFSNEFVKEVSLEILFKESNVLSLHIPLTEESRYMVNDTFINAFQHSIYLINTARGKILDTSSLVRGIESGKIISAALDVLEYENTSFENLLTNTDSTPLPLKYLLNSEKVILSPHIAGWSFESNEKIARILVDKIRSCISKI